MGDEAAAILCTVLHFGLVAAHIILFVIYSHHYERSVVANLDSFSSNWLPLIVTTVSQVVGTASSMSSWPSSPVSYRIIRFILLSLYC